MRTYQSEELEYEEYEDELVLCELLERLFDSFGLLRLLRLSSLFSAFFSGLLNTSLRFEDFAVLSTSGGCVDESTTAFTSVLDLLNILINYLKDMKR